MRALIVVMIFSFKSLKDMMFYNSEIYDLVGLTKFDRLTIFILGLSEIER